MTRHDVRVDRDAAVEEMDEPESEQDAGRVDSSAVFDGHQHHRQDLRAVQHTDLKRHAL